MLSVLHGNRGISQYSILYGTPAGPHSTYSYDVYAGFTSRRLIFLTFVETAGFTAAFALKARLDAAVPRSCLPSSFVSNSEPPSPFQSPFHVPSDLVFLLPRTFVVTAWLALREIPFIKLFLFLTAESYASKFHQLRYAQSVASEIT